MNARTKQHRAWHRELMAEWDARGQNGCELCGSTFGQALAHSKKRRLIYTKEDYFTVCLLCVSCHHLIEYGTKDEPGTHERMERLVKEIIARREGYAPSHGSNTDRNEV